MSFSFDYSYMQLGEQSLVMQKQVAAAYAQIQKAKQAGELGFSKLPYQEEEVQKIEALAAEIRQECQDLVVIGIGGSDLGARAVQRALNHQFHNLVTTPRIFFLGDTTDPVAIQEVLQVINWEKAVFVVISKSGNTVEQMSTFIYIRQLLLDKVEATQAARQIVILTDAEKGTLREIVQKEGYRSLVVPAEVGGRFSVLSSIGLFPLAVAGIDIRQLVAGAAWFDQQDSKDLVNNIALTYASLQYQGYQMGRTITVLMPYVYSLREVGFWFRQLWAESLGKKLNLLGEEVKVGPTPIAAIGPTDQHSQAQLYMEGPDNKLFTFITLEKYATDMQLPEAFPEQEGVSYLKGHSFQEIVLAEQKSTAYALFQAGRPSCCICLEKLDAYHLGALLYFFELATSYAGVLFNINTFDQPGVEASKNYMYTLLGRPGFEEWQMQEVDNRKLITLN